jgi:NADH-quinone oxidoreductase subunit G
MEGRAQAFNAVAKPQGEARPGWKVLRMLGALLELPGFQPDAIEDVRKQIAPDVSAWATAGLGNTAESFTWELRTPTAAIERVGEFGIYATDPIVRRSLPLQKTADGKASRAARLNAATMSRLGVQPGDRVRVSQGGGEAMLTVALDEALPDNTARVARGVPETAMLGEGEMSIERVRETAAA